MTDAGFVPCAESGMITLCALLAVRVVVRAHEQEPRQLAGRARRGLQGRRVHAGDLAQLALEVAQQLEPALAERGGGRGVDVAPSPAVAATSSKAFGLYFIVHDPSG